MLRRALRSAPILLLLVLTAGVAAASVPKLIVLEHFADYFG